MVRVATNIVSGLKLKLRPGKGCSSYETLHGSTHSEMAEANRRALITGTTGQDGSYLAELLRKGVRGAWHQAQGQQFQHHPDRSPLPGSA